MCKTKYLIIISAILLLSGIAFAQLNESFTGTLFPPDGWTRYNLGTTPGDSWDRYTVYYYSAPACARIYYDLPNNDWLITPKLVVQTGDSLKFFWRKQSTSYVESLYIRLSTTSTDTSAFTVFLDSMFGPVGDTTWHYKAINLSSYAGNNAYIAFFYKDNNNYGVAIDDVTGPAVWMPANDVGVQQILSPSFQHLVNTSMTPSAKIKNYGTNNQNNFSVVCSIVNTSGTVRYTNTKTVSLASGRDTTINFNSWTPTTTELCTVYVRTKLADDNPDNNLKKIACDISNYITIGTGTTASSLYPMYCLYAYSVSEAIYLQSEINNAGYLCNLAYYKGSGTTLTSIESVAIFMKHTTEATVATGAWDTTGYTLVYAGAFPNDATDGWMDITLDSPFNYNNTDNLKVLIVKGAPAISTGYPTWRYTSTSPDNRNRYAYGATLPTSLTQTTSRPNIRFSLLPTAPTTDGGVQQILSPGATHLLGTAMTPSAKVKNYGTSNQPSFSVICSIVGSVSGYLYSNTKTFSLNAGRDTIVNFNPFTPTTAELCTVKIRTTLAGDENPTNNRKTRTTDVSSYITIGTGTLTSSLYPIYCYSAYSVSEAIYLQSEIGYVANITNLAYYKGSGTDVNPIQYVTIYMKHTTATTVATGAWDYSGYTQVFSGSFPNDATAGWMDITLDSPFNYNNSENLQILVVKGPYSFTTGYPYWRYTTTTDNKNRYGSGAGLPTSLTATTSRPNIRFVLTTGAPPANDVGVQSILSPVGTINLRTTTSVPVRAIVKNYGTNIQTNFAVRCTIWGPGHTQEYANLRTISLNAGDTVTVAFDNWTPSTFGACSVIVRTMLTDDNPTNDRKVAIATLVRAYCTGGPDAGNMRWIDSDTTGGPVYNWIDISRPGAYDDTCRTGDDQYKSGLPLGFTFNFYDKPRTTFSFCTNGFICFDALTSSYLTNATMPTSALPNNIIAPFWDDLKMVGSWHKTFYSPDTFKVIQWKGAHLAATDSVDFQVILKKNGDIIFQYDRCLPGSYSYGQSATVGIEDSTGLIGLQYLYNGTPTGNLLSAPRAIKFYYQPLGHDVGVEAILSPGALHPTNIQMTPQASVRNYGTANQTNFPVVCSIFGRVSGPLYNDVRTISLNAGATTTVSFNAWTPSVEETLTVKMATALVGDERTANDIKTRLTAVQQVVDASVTAITSPATTETKRVQFTPQVTVTNNGSNAEDIPVIAEIYDIAPTDLKELKGKDLSSLTKIDNNVNKTVSLEAVCPYASQDKQDEIVYEPMLPLSTEDTIRYDGVNYTGIGFASGGPYFYVPAVRFTPVHSCSVKSIVFYKYGAYAHSGYLYIRNTGTPTSPGAIIESVPYTCPSAGWYRVNFASSYYFAAGNDFWLAIGFVVVAPQYPMGCDAGPRLPGRSFHSVDGSPFEETALNYNYNIRAVGKYIPIYRDSVSVSVDYGKASTEAIFNRPCTLMTEGDYQFISYTKLSGDMVPGNDQMTRNFSITQATLTLSSPTNGASISDNTPTFSWNGVTGAELYRIEVDNDSNFSTPEFAGTLGDLEIESDPLAEDTYYWHVRAESPGTPDPYSEVWTVNIITQLPPPTLVSPTDGETLYTDQQTFIWNSVPGAVRYNLIAGSMSVETPETTYTAGLAGGDYTWQVRSQSPTLVWGDFSTPWSFTVLIAPWLPRPDTFPSQVTGKGVKDGGTMIAVSGTKDGDIIFTFRGNKSNEFYRYNPGPPGVWTTMETIPFTNKPGTVNINKKRVGKGGALCWDGGNIIYATKGNSTRELWAYYINPEGEIPGDTWVAKEFITYPPIKGIKGGTSMAFKDGKLYVLVGGQKAVDPNFFEYDTATNIWTQLLSAPTLPDGKAFKDGSCIALIGDTIYALKGGGKHNYFYRYPLDAPTPQWTLVETETIPRRYPTTMIAKPWKSTVKDGGAMTVAEGELYAIKGGGKQDFWKYTPGEPAGLWTPLDTIPRLHKKSVPKTGASVTYLGSAIYIIKGNNTTEVWKYPLPSKTITRVNPTTALQEVCRQSTVDGQRFDATPNPFSKITTIRYTVPVSGKVAIKLYNASGRLVETLNNSYLNAGSYAMRLNANTLAKGVYFLRYDDITNRAEIKLIVQ